MIPVLSGVRVWLAVGRTDMRRGMNGLALQVQEALRRDPHAGDLFVFRGARGDLIKIIWHDGLGMSLWFQRQSSIASWNTPCAVLPSLPFRSTANRYGTISRVVGVANSSPPMKARASDDGP